MKVLIYKKIIVIVFCFGLTVPVSMAQMDNTDFFRAGAGDAVKLIEEYINPWANAFGAGLNGSWYNTAKPHKWAGFDLTFGVNAGFVPPSAETFDISELDLSPLVTGTGIAPTVAGPGEEGPEMTVQAEGITLATFRTPPGTGWKIVPVPTATVGIGLPFGTELKGRFIPKINIGDGGNVSLWGAGIMHSIMQYIPGNNLMPFDISAFAGFTRLSGNVKLLLQPGEPQNYIDFNPDTDFGNQQLTATIDALNAGIIGSFNLPVITLYGGLGYSKTRTGVTLKGLYPTPVAVTDPVTPHAEYNDNGVIAGEDFPAIEIENFSGLRANAGIRLKLAIFTFHVDYTRSHYNVLSTGLGISFR